MATVFTVGGLYVWVVVGGVRWQWWLVAVAVTDASIDASGLISSDAFALSSRGDLCQI